MYTLPNLVNLLYFLSHPSLMYRVFSESTSASKLKEYIDTTSSFSQHFYTRTSATASYGRYLKFHALSISPEVSYEFVFTCDINEAGLPDKIILRVLFPRYKTREPPADDIFSLHKFALVDEILSNQ